MTGALRRAFDAWVSGPPFELSIDRNGPLGAWPGAYRATQVHAMWDAYQEGARQIQAVSKDTEIARLMADNDAMRVREGEMFEQAHGYLFRAQAVESALAAERAKVRELRDDLQCEREKLSAEAQAHPESFIASSWLGGLNWVAMRLDVLGLTGEVPR